MHSYMASMEYNSYGGSEPQRPVDIYESVTLCILLEICRQHKMDCDDMMALKNRTSFTDAYDRPKEAIVGMLSVFALFGTLGNALVLYVYVRKKNKLASTVFIISLAATDFMTSCLIMPFTMTMELLDYFTVYDSVCKVYFFLITCNVPFAAFIMVAIAVDRYLCICRPHCHVLDSRRSQIGVIFLALISATFGILTALFHGVYIIETFRVNPENETEIMEKVQAGIVKDLFNNRTEVVSENCETHCDEVTDNTTEAYIRDTARTMVDMCQHSSMTLYTGQCLSNEIILNSSFRKVYQRAYASMFLVCFVIVFLLYISIYRSVLVLRTKRLRQRQKTNSRLLRDVSVTDTHQTTAETPLQMPLQEASVQNGGGGGCGNRGGGSYEMAEMSGEKRKAMLESDNCLKEKYLLANIRTAVMLFVVTLVFILAFLPSWLMAHGVVRFHAVVFYFYFAYNVSNPIIYAFMNPTFRKELQEVLCCWRGFRSRNSTFDK
ncbi:cholecystokinin receptor type A-like [Littorina saxatilis]|uniref:cholecystokinin receptor type A-like n=1 Tax=Littorina saxatilis TaxID=31220 RepID=UPI0038B582D0